MAAPNYTSKVRLLDVAKCLFARKGYDATMTPEIVAQSGGTLGTFSHHFNSRNVLLVEVVSRRFDDLGGAAPRAVTGDGRCRWTRTVR